MACEMFVLGNRDFRLPGLGSYLQTAAGAGDTQSILWGVGVMIAVIVLMDQIIWRPVIAWAEKFKMEQVESGDAPQSWFLDVIQHSRGLVRLRKRAINPLRERLALHFARQHNATVQDVPRDSMEGVDRTGHCRGVILVAVLYAVVRATGMMASLARPGVQGNIGRSRCDLSASRTGVGHRRGVDHSSWCGDRLQSHGCRGLRSRWPRSQRQFPRRRCSQLSCWH